MEASWQVLDLDSNGPLLNEYISAEAHGIEITLRFLCGIESARDIKHRFTTKMLHVVRVNNSLNLAYPTRRMIGLSEAEAPNMSFPSASPSISLSSQNLREPQGSQDKPKRTFTHPIEKIEMTA